MGVRDMDGDKDDGEDEDGGLGKWYCVGIVRTGWRMGDGRKR